MGARSSPGLRSPQLSYSSRTISSGLSSGGHGLGLGGGSGFGVHASNRGSSLFAGSSSATTRPTPYNLSTTSYLQTPSQVRGRPSFVQGLVLHCVSSLCRDVGCGRLVAAASRWAPNTGTSGLWESAVQIFNSSVMRALSTPQPLLAPVTTPSPYFRPLTTPIAASRIAATPVRPTSASLMFERPAVFSSSRMSSRHSFRNASPFDLRKYDDW